MKIDVIDLMERAFVAGFVASSEGYNGEYPFDKDKRNIHRELQLQANEAIEDIFATAELSQNNNPEWQPIETAPLNTPILVWLESENIQKISQQIVLLQHEHLGEKWWETTDRLDQLSLDLTPTHWMPLPPPPQEGE